MESQSRVGRWVDNANEHAREFANPFVPTHVDPAEKSDFYSSSSHRRTQSSSAKHSTTRSFTVPQSQDRPRGASSHHQSSHRSGTSSNTRSSSSSSSSSVSTARPHNSRSYTVHTQHPTQGARAPLPQPVRSRTMPGGYHYELDPRAKGDIILPPIQPGQTYVIVPPHGRQVNVISPDRSHVVHRVMSPTPSYQSSPNKEQPLIKRLFGFGSPSGGSSRSGSHSSRKTGVETGGKPRRSHGRRTSY